MHFVVLPRLPVHAVDVPSLERAHRPSRRAACSSRAGCCLILDEERPDERAAPGTLIDQRPLAGRACAAARTCTPRVAKAVRMPKLVGMTVDAARDALDAAEAEAGRGDRGLVGDGAARGRCWRRTRRPGAEGRPDGTVDLQLSTRAGGAAGAVGDRQVEVRGEGRCWRRPGSPSARMRSAPTTTTTRASSSASSRRRTRRRRPGTKIDLTIND